MKIKLSHEEVEHKLFLEVIGVYLVLALVLVGAYYLEPVITGFAIVTKQSNYVDDVNLEFSESSSYVWAMSNPGNLKSVKIDGSIIGNGEAKVYIEDDGERYLIFDSSKLVETESGLFSITGLVVDEEEITINESLINETTINDTETIINETDEKIINIEFGYGNDPIYDANNDGIESESGIVDFSIDGDFNWDVDESKLCTRYEIFSIEDQESNFACFGSDSCCGFVDLESSRDSWNESLYLVYGGYGSSLNNLVLGQVLYVDYDLDSDDPYSDIAYSSWGNLTAEFIKNIVEFEDVCIDSCSFNGNESSYNLIVELENATLRIDDIKYLIEEDATNAVPVLAKDIGDISIFEDEEYILGLSVYFSDEDGDKLTYGYSEMDNITISFEDDFAYIIPDEGFLGNRTTSITANDSYGFISSNVFNIEVRQIDVSSQNFEIRGVGDIKLAVFNSLGSLDIRGNFTEGIIADDNDFVIDGLNNSPNLVITNPEGNLGISGSLIENRTELSPADNSFIIKDKDGNVVAYVDSTGSLFLKGILTEEVLFG